MKIKMKKGLLSAGFLKITNTVGSLSAVRQS